MNHFSLAMVVCIVYANYIIIARVYFFQLPPPLLILLFSCLDIVCTLWCVLYGGTPLAQVT